MVDFWCTLGQMVVDPNFLNVVDVATHPSFTPVPTELYEKGVKEVTFTAAGHSNANVEIHRSALQNALNNKGVRLPVSLYTAARIAQLKTVDQAKLSTAAEQAHTAYQAAAAASGLTNGPGGTLAAALGLTLLDSEVSARFVNPATEPQIANDLFLDSNPNSPERRTARAFAAHANLADARDTLLAASDWPGGCREGMTFYSGFRRATL
ncbi:MAG: hypothetical protein SFV18_01055 [Bryobacteraceae bacterium]|nr:hypothetical protein [Bryobacteraceae bacterium]